MKFEPRITIRNIISYANLHPGVTSTFWIVAAIIIAIPIFYRFMVGSSPYAYQDFSPELTTGFFRNDDSTHLFTATDPKSKASLSLSVELENPEVKNSEIKNGDSPTVTDVFPYTDLTYQVIANGVKEDIILKSKEALTATGSDALEYKFSLNLSGLITRKLEDGTISPNFTIGEGSESFQILPLYMEDANGATSYEVSLAISETEQPDVLSMTVTPNMEWLSDPARVFPIHIDPSVVKGNAPVAQWSMDEGFGTTTNDGSTNLNHLTITNATWEKTSDRMNASSATYLEFDGTGDYLSRTSDADFDFGTGSFSLSGWFKHNSTAALDIIMAHTGAVNGIGWKVYLDASGYLCFGIDDDTTSFPEKSACSTSTQGSLADSRWHHFEAVKSGTTSITIYLDGRPITTTSIAGTTGTLTNSVTLHIGIDGDASTNAWTGFLDNLTIYNYERTAAQVQADALAVSSAQASVSFGAAPKDTLTDGLVGWWKMDDSGVDAEGETSTDASGNANNGTLYGDDASGDNGTGMTCTATGKFGTGCDFDGEDDVITVPDSNSLDLSTQITTAAWIFIASGEPQHDHEIFAKPNGSTPNFMFRAQRSAGSNYRPMFIFYSTGAEYSLYAADSYSLSLDTWYYLVATYDASTFTAKVYINGNEVPGTWDAGDDDNGAMQPNTNSLRIGNGDHRFEGIIDEARIYNRALSPAEVRQLYNWAPGPVAYYPMDENTGTSSVNDKSGTGNTLTMEGTMTNADWLPGKFGSALDFDGTDDRLRINDGSQTGLDLSSTFSIGGWFYFDTTPAATRIMGKYYNAGGGRSWEMRAANPDGTILTVNLSNDGTTNNGINTATGFLSSDTWMHIFTVYDGNTVNLYKNGIKYTGGGFPDSYSSTLYNSSQPVCIGSASSNGACATGTFFDGKIDEVKIYNYARTPSQIIEDMNAGHPVGGSPVGSQVGYWKFDEGYGTTAHDLSNDTNDNDLTLSAAGWTTSGKFGSAYDGADNRRLSRADDADFDFSETEDFSISGWFNHAAASVAEVILNKEESAGADGGYRIQMESDGDITFGIDDDNASFPEDSVTSTAATYDDGTWHHFLAVKTGTTSMRLYIDGKEVGTADTPISSTGTLVNDDILYIGDAQATNGTDEWLGDLDEIKIYRAALTPEQIKTEYAHGSAAIWGASSTASDGITADNSTAREFCVPGDTTSCSAPVGWWKMDENTGTTSTYDNSGNSNTGTLGGSMTISDWVTGKIGSALDFDGSDDYISISGSNFNYGKSDGYSLSLWFKSTEACTNYRTLLEKRDTATASPWDITLENGTCYFQVATWDGASAAPVIKSSSGVNDGLWHFGSMVHYSNGTFDAYLDGAKLGSATDAAGNTNNAGAVTIAQDNALTPDRNFQGLIDDVRIYNYARTPAQIAWDYNRGAPIGWWKMDDCTGTEVDDNSLNASGESNAHHGTWSGNGGSNTSEGTCTSGNSAHAWYNGANGKRNASLDFDGTDDYVEVADTSTLRLSTAMSLSVWFKTTSVDTGVQGIARKETESGTRYLWGINYSNKKVYNDYYNGAGFGVTSTQDINDGSWHHAVSTINGTSLSFYLDGILQGTDTISGTQNPPTGRFAIGALPPYSGQGVPSYYYFFDGQIDEVKIWNYALTAKQVQLEYNGGAVNFSN